MHFELVLGVWISWQLSESRIFYRISRFGIRNSAVRANMHVRDCLLYDVHWNLEKKFVTKFSFLL